MLKRIWKRIALGVVALVALSGGVQGAEIISQELFHDGSTNPPGFRIDVRLMWESSEEPAVIQVKGFVALLGKPTAKTAPIKSEVKTQSDQAGNFTIEQKVTPDEQGTCSIVVPYASLKIPQGDSAVWFQVTLMRDGKAIVSTPTNVINLKIGDQTRETITTSATVYEKRTSVKPVKVFIAEPDLEEGIKSFPMPDQPVPQKLTEKDVVETRTYKVGKVVHEVRATKIPGGFEEAKPVEQPSTDTPADSLQASDLKSLDGPWTTLKEAGDENDRIVYFATNRTPDAMDWPKKKVSNIPKTVVAEGDEEALPQVADEVRYGWCRVNIPVKEIKKPQPGFLGGLSLPIKIGQPDPVKDYTIQTLEYVNKEAFQNGVQKGDVLLYVHGFCNQFSDAVLRTAQLRYELEFPGQAVAFCWPSEGELFKAVLGMLQDPDNPKWQEVAKNSGYLKAQNAADASIKHLAEVIKLLGAKRPDGSRPRIHFIAHSMGNRVLLKAISRLSSEGFLNKKNEFIANIVLAAPDVAVFDFYNLIPQCIAHSQRTTFYFCDHDSALRFSKEINRQDPVGFLPFLMLGLDSIDASAVDTSFLAHSYYATSPEVLSDIRLLIKKDAPPKKRMPPLGAKLEFSSKTYWSFDKAGTVNLVVTDSKEKQ